MYLIEFTGLTFHSDLGKVTHDSFGIHAKSYAFNNLFFHVSGKNLEHTFFLTVRPESPECEHTCGFVNLGEFLPMEITVNKKTVYVYRSDWRMINIPKMFPKMEMEKEGESIF